MTTTHQSGPAAHSRDGMVLFVVLAVIGALAALGATMFLVSSTDLRIVWFSRQSANAFASADSGVHYVRTRIEQDLQSGAITLSNASENVSYSAPSGYYFGAVTSLVRVCSGANPTYEYSVRGRFSNAETRIEATFQRKPALDVGVFADSLLDTKANGSIYSYYSDQVFSPAPSNSTGEADSGSNEDIVTHVGTFIDGDLIYGEDIYGNPVHRADPGDGSIITGTEGLEAGRLDPDPLGVIGGDLAAEFTAVATANNNASAIPAIPSGTKKIQLGNGETMVLSPGNYYVSSIDMGNGASLTINNTGGVVKIYLYGAADFKNGSTVNVTGQPSNFALYSNSSQGIRLFNSSTFKGFIYAPRAMVEVKNSGSFFGVVWADSVDIKNSGDVFIDMTLMNRVLTKKVRLLSWKEVR